MSDDVRKKHGWWFWTKFTIVALAIYLSSFVGLIGLDARLMADGQSRALRIIYAPIIWAVMQFGR